MTNEFYIVAVDFRGEYYAIGYCSTERTEALMQVYRWAENPELAFDWDCGTVMAERIIAHHEQEKFAACGGR